MAESRTDPRGRERYSPLTIIINNVLFALILITGAALCGLLWRPLGWIYAITGLVMAVFVLRALVCVHCRYYDKWCATGWGKLAALMFRKGDEEHFSDCPGVKMAPWFYFDLLFFPLLCGGIAAYTKPDTSLDLLALLAAALLVEGYVFAILIRRRTCAECRMRGECPGSAV